MMKKSFTNLGINAPILKALHEMGFESPTEVQSQAIPHVLRQEDVIVMSQTGSGKTAVFGIPLLQMIDSGATGVQALILTPTRELAVQVDNDLKQMASYLEHKTTAVYGQHNINVEIEDLNKGVAIVTGTPGRVYDHISNGSLITEQIRFLVLDEADRMLDMGFLDQVKRIVETLPTDRITLLFSATIPAEIQEVCREYMKNPVAIKIESETLTVETTEQVYYRVNPNEKRLQLHRILLYEQPESCIIFCNTRNSVDRVQNFLYRKGYAVRALHGDIPQTKRLKTLQQFKNGVFNLLVATDVASRGIHIDELSLVINYDVPIEKDSYVHRIGRTGRAGKVGRAVSLVTGEDIMTLYEIEEHIGTLIEEMPLPPETFFTEHKSSIDKWIKTNTIKSRPPGNRTGKSKERQKRSYSQNHHARHRAQTSRANPAGPDNSAKTDLVVPPHTQKSAQTVTKPAPCSIKQNDALDSKKTGAEILPKQPALAKKPFLKLLFQKILGK